MGEFEMLGLLSLLSEEFFFRSVKILQQSGEIFSIQVKKWTRLPGQSSSK
jgi:hypothetical protein